METGPLPHQNSCHPICSYTPTSAEKELTGEGANSLHRQSNQFQCILISHCCCFSYDCVKVFHMKSLLSPL